MLGAGGTLVVPLELGNLDSSVEGHGLRSGEQQALFLLTSRHLISILMGRRVFLASSYIKISVNVNDYTSPLSLNIIEIYSSGQFRVEVIGCRSTGTSPCLP